MVGILSNLIVEIGRHDVELISIVAISPWNCIASIIITHLSTPVTLPIIVEEAVDIEVVC